MTDFYSKYSPNNAKQQDNSKKPIVGGLSERNNQQNAKFLRKDLVTPAPGRGLGLPLFYRYDTEVDKKVIIEGILNGVFDRSKKLGKYELMFKNVLFNENFNTLHEAIRLPILENKYNERKIVGEFVPDFLLPFHYVTAADGLSKAIVIEPHGRRFIDTQYLKKLNYVRENYGLYVVLATHSWGCYGNFATNEIEKNVDELWDISDRSTGRRKLKDNIHSLVEKAYVGKFSVFEGLLDKLRD